MHDRRARSKETLRDALFASGGAEWGTQFVIYQLQTHRGLLLSSRRADGPAVIVCAPAADGCAGAGSHWCLPSPARFAAGSSDWTWVRMKTTRSWRCSQCWPLRLLAAPGCSNRWPPPGSAEGQTGRAALRCHPGRWGSRWSPRCCRTDSDPPLHRLCCCHRLHPPGAKTEAWSPRRRHTLGTSGAFEPRRRGCPAASLTYDQT